jgi:Uma2 family endonuclease
MEALQNPTRISVEDYIAGELQSDVRHEYLWGVVYAMAGGSTDHNTIAGNIFAALRQHVRGGPCQVFFVDVKVRLRIAEEDVFYYPDIMVFPAFPDGVDRSAFAGHRAD